MEFLIHFRGIEKVIERPVVEFMQEFGHQMIPDQFRGV